MNYNKKKGFTFIECIVVITLISIVAMVASSRFANVTTFKKLANYDMVLNFLRLGNKTALLQNRSLYVVHADNELRLCYVNASPCPDASSMLSQGQVMKIATPSMELMLPPDLGFNSKGATLTGQTQSLSIGGQLIYVEGANGYVHR